jgi:molybdopterin-guanine dinucleotide biosynthesis protein A
MFDEFSGYILAGGKSSRMGTDKAFLKIGDKTFLENAVEILRPICDTRIKIVLNQNQTHFTEKFPQKIPSIFDIYKNRGVLSGIHAAFKDCQTKYAVILAVDLPLVKTDVILKLSTYLTHSQNFSAIVPEQANYKLQPLCGIYKMSSCLPILEKLLEENNSASVNQFLELIDTKIINYKKLQIDSKAFLNVNSAMDYEDMKNII